MTQSNNLDELVKDLRRKGPGKGAFARSYRILFLEDNPDDVELMQHELREARFPFTAHRVEKKVDFLRQVFEFTPDVILADYSLATFNGMQAFHMLRNEKLIIPFILVTGVLSEQLALECMKEGIDDFVLKSSFKRLPNAILTAIRKKEVVNEKDRIASELEKSHQELTLFIDRQQVSLEEERKQIARDLHDELGQVLTALKIDISMLWRKCAADRLSVDEINAAFGAVTKLVDQITFSVKSIASGLRPDTLDEPGIMEAIKWQAVEFERRTNISCKTFLPIDLLEIDSVLSITIFRIVQESLTNVLRHAMASRVEIYLEKVDNVIILEIKDNGKGIEKSQIMSSKSMGIIGLRERVRVQKGQFDIRKLEEGGTKVSVLIPMNK